MEALKHAGGGNRPERLMPGEGTAKLTPEPDTVPPTLPPELEALLADHLDALASGVAARLSPAVLDGLEARVRRILRDELQRQAEPAPLWDVATVARRLGVSDRSVEKIIACGELRPLWIGGVRRFDPRTVEAYIKSRVATEEGGKPARKGARRGVAA